MEMEESAWEWENCGEGADERSIMYENCALLVSEINLTSLSIDTD